MVKKEIAVTPFDITPKMHRRTGELVSYFTDWVRQVNTTGTLSRLPTYGEIAQLYGVSFDTVLSVVQRLGVDAEIAKTRKVDKAGIEASYEQIIRDVHDGLSDQVLSYTGMSLVYGCSSMKVAEAVRENRDLQRRLAEAREIAAKRRQEQIIFRENEQTAWFLGAMVGGGSLKKGSKATGLILTSSDSEVLEMFKVIGEDILGKRGLERQLRDRNNPSVVFNHVGYAKLLDPFSRESRAQISANNEWVRDERFLTSFLSGIFDAGGLVSFTDERRRVSFATTSEIVADFYYSLLKQFGIKLPRIERQKKGDSKSKCVYFGTLPDLKAFAASIVSVSPEKQNVLDIIKSYPSTESGKYSSLHQVYP